MVTGDLKHTAGKERLAHQNWRVESRGSQASEAMWEDRGDKN